jgi:hypothetical protein
MINVNDLNFFNPCKMYLRRNFKVPERLFELHEIVDL